MRRFVSIAVLFIFWLAITGSVKPLDLGVGLLLAVRAWTRLPGYVAWLLKEIVVAALYVAERVLDPRLSISPVMHTHRVRFECDAARVAFANSITLTPGTITVDVSEDTFVIHCLQASFSDTISSGDLERRVSRTFDG